MLMKTMTVMPINVAKASFITYVWRNFAAPIPEADINAMVQLCVAMEAAASTVTIEEADESDDAFSSCGEEIVR
jgi:hypothetical protein